ncbi:MAG: methyltransferase domain-containing protein [Deltaproteobacteria bacterium]|nr:methyltransferase domain-containing protein [Deltaproteobacteria bacterium]
MQTDSSDKINEAFSIVGNDKFPRSGKYDPMWVLENQMGPNALWLLEWLCEKMDFKPGMRVLDLGCGRALTSVFLAREFGVKVWAADLWIDPDYNWQRVLEAGCGDSICPVRCEAHALPFAKGFFDAVVSIDAYQYFGTDELYLDYLSRFLRPGGQIGVVVAGLAAPFENGVVPDYLLEPQSNGKVFWSDGCRCFKTAEFWRNLWAGNAKVADVSVDTQPEGWKDWRDFERAIELAGKGIFPSEAEVLTTDGGRYMGFHRLVARTSGLDDVNIYDSNLGAKVGIY